MADRRDYYFRQKVTEAELDAGFEGLEVADRDLAVDHDLIGIVDGMEVSEKSGTPDLTVDVDGPGAAYSKQGERIFFSSLQNVDLSQDDAAVSTAVAAPGNSRVVSLFVEFDRTLSDPRIDGNSLTVFFQRDEAFSFSVVAGGEATTGTESPPAIDPNKILLADITLDFGQTQILNADVDVSRREDAYRLSGTLAVVGGSAKEAITALLAGLNTHIDGGGFKHAAVAVEYTPGAGSWSDALVALAGTTQAQDAIDAIVSELASQAATSGADRLGVRATTSGGRTFPASSIRAALLAMLGMIDGNANKTAANVFTVVGNVFQEILGLEKGLNVGTGLTSAANALVARLQPTVVAGATEARTLLLENVGGNAQKIRLYYNDDTGSTVAPGFEITVNARWTAAGWVRDAVGNASTFRVMDTGFEAKHYFAAPAGAWADNAWEGSIDWFGDDALRVMNTDSSGEHIKMRPEVIEFNNPGSGGFASLGNPNSTVAVTNQIQPKNSPKAWARLRAGGTPTVQNGYNIASVSLAGNTMVVSFAAGMVDTDFVGVATMSTNTNVNMTVVNLGLTSCQVYAWDADTGAAIDLGSGSDELSLIVLGEQ